MTGRPQELKKILGLWDSVAIIIAIVIGVGIFRVPAEVARYLNSPAVILLAWFLGGAISLIGALCFAELASTFPRTGGNYIYLAKSYGNWAGFLFGWSELLVVRTGSVASITFVFAECAASFFGLDDSSVKSIAITTIIVISAINIFGLQYGKRIQDVFTVAKMVIIAVFIATGFFIGKGIAKNVTYAPAASVPAMGMAQAFGLALIPILWTYGGWHENTFLAGETKNARIIVPLALLLGISGVSVVYLMMNALYMHLVPVKTIATTELIGSYILHILYGDSGKKALDALLMIFSFGCINAMIMTGSRVTYAMAQDNIIFGYLSKVSHTYKTPYRAIIINAIVSIMLIAVGTFNQILFFTGILVWFFFALTAGSLYILRRKFPSAERPYHVWGYPITPAVFMLICIILFANTFISYTFQSCIGLCLLASGIPAFMLSQYLRKYSVHC